MRPLYVSHSHKSLARLPHTQSQEGAPTDCEADTSSPSRSTLLSEHEVKAREEDESDMRSRSDMTIFRFGLAAPFVTLLLPALVRVVHPLGSCAFEVLTAPLAVDQQQHRSSVGNATTISNTIVTPVPQICQAEVRKKGGWVGVLCIEGERGGFALAHSYTNTPCTAPPAPFRFRPAAAWTDGGARARNDGGRLGTNLLFRSLDHDEYHPRVPRTAHQGHRGATVSTGPQGLCQARDKGELFCVLFFCRVGKRSS